MTCGMKKLLSRYRKLSRTVLQKSEDHVWNDSGLVLGKILISVSSDENVCEKRRSLDLAQDVLGIGLSVGDFRRNGGDGGCRFEVLFPELLLLLNLEQEDIDDLWEECGERQLDKRAV